MGENATVRSLTYPLFSSCCYVLSVKYSTLGQDNATGTVRRADLYHHTNYAGVFLHLLGVVASERRDRLRPRRMGCKKVLGREYSSKLDNNR